MIAYILAGLLLIGGTANALAQPPATNVVKYHATINDVKYVYAVAPPVAHLKSGDILETNTVDAFGNVIQKPSDPLTLVKGDNPLTGPFYIEGAESGDTLAVKILDLEVDSNQGVGAFAPGFGALNKTTYTPMLHTPLPEKIWFYPIDHAPNTATFHALDYRSGGLWRQHGFSRGERAEHCVLSGECVRCVVVHGRWARCDGRWRNCGNSD